MNLSPLTRLVLVADNRPVAAEAPARRYRVARLDLRSPQGESRFEHLGRSYD